MKVLHVFTILFTAKVFFDGQFKFLTENNQEIMVVSSSDEDHNFSVYNRISYQKINIERKISPFADLKSIGSLRSLIRREKFDIVVGHTPKGAMVAMIAAKLAGVKTRLYYRHGLIYTTAEGLKCKIFKTVEKFTAMFATNIVNVSPSLSRLAVNDNLNTDKKQTVIGAGTCGGIDTKYTFNPNYVTPESLISLRESLGINKDDFVVGFCGRLCRDKGIIELISGFKQFQSQNPDISAKLLLVGPYDERDILPDNIKKLIATDENIITTGMVDKTNLPSYYAIMNLFVFPSYREGFGMCVIEASAMEKPILVSRSHGCEDSILENVTGEYIELSADDICKGINEFTSSDKQIRYGKNGRKWVTENFERTNLWPLIADYYREIQSVK